MKTLIPIILATILIMGGCTPERETQMVEAEVLTINENVLQGKLIGGFLSGSSGWLNSSTVIVGIKVVYSDMLFLIDIDISTAELAHFKDRNTLPIWIDYMPDLSTQCNFYEEIIMYFMGKRVLYWCGHRNYAEGIRRLQEAKRLYREEQP